MGVQAVLFDWGGTLSTYRHVDLLEMWRAAAGVLAPDDPEPFAAALLAAEAAWWQHSTEHGDRSGTTAQLVRSVARTAHVDVDVENALAAYHDAWTLTVEHDPHAAAVLTGLRQRGLRTGMLSNTHWPRDLHERGSPTPGYATYSTSGSTPPTCPTSNPTRRPSRPCCPRSASAPAKPCSSATGPVTTSGARSAPGCAQCC